MKAYWGKQEALIASEHDLRSVLKAVRQVGQPTMLFLEHDSGTNLVLGIGGSESVVTFVDTDGQSFHSVGDTTRTGRLRFLCRDQVDEFMEEMAVPEDVAIAMSYEFVISGERPEGVLWEADW